MVKRWMSYWILICGSNIKKSDIDLSRIRQRSCVFSGSAYFRIEIPYFEFIMFNFVYNFEEVKLVT